MIYLLILFAGLALLYGGAEVLVRGSVGVALRWGLTRLVVGLTVVAFGTSSPELVVSIKAALDGNGAISLGNVIGSNICNIALILGLSALIRPLTIDQQVVRIQIPIMIGVSLVLPLFLSDGRLGRFEGGLLFFGILSYTTVSILLARREAGKNAGTAKENGSGTRPAGSSWTFLLMILLGLGMLVYGAHLFLKGAVALAGILGVSHAVIALTIVALGTSLPELATSVVASFRGEGDISVGNVVGSNIFNILSILGIASLVRPIVSEGIGLLDYALMIATAVLLLPMARTGFVLSRMEGAIMLGMYVGYTAYLMA
ncbi:MAG: calcium/sodium antiporter [Deltaproteobacteria bacterium]|nr:calcium/sodium antiporter [Deltaproteobacteria bacterium]